MMSEATVYLEQIRELSGTLERIIDDVSAEHFNQRPGPHLNPVGWNCFHLLRIWDLDLNWACKGQPKDQDAWHRGDFSEKSGYDPDGKGGLGYGVGWGYSDDEVDELQIEADVLKQYQRMLMDETEDYLGTVDEDELRRLTESVVHPGQFSSVAQRMHHLIGHSYGHVGEIRYALGVLGWRDASYPGPSS
jgi:hypothetical protein